jgi:hypothetical protein
MAHQNKNFFYCLPPTFIMSIKPSAYAQHFVGLTMPPQLLPLLEFYNNCGPEYFSQGFELEIFEDKDYVLASYSEDAKFIAAFGKIGQSNGSGSLYYFWLQDGNTDLSRVLIVSFGDEGGIEIAATNFRQLLQNLTCDCEFRGSYSERFALVDEVPSGQSETYRAWLMDNYGIAAIDAPTANRDNVEPAHSQHQEIFSKWLLTFGIDLNNY